MPAAATATSATDAERKAFDTLRAAAARKAIATYELAHGEGFLVCRPGWPIREVRDLEALAALLEAQGVTL
jgi:hypothetical protein